MKRIFTLGCAIALYGTVNAQISDPSPYCASAFDNNYNMFNNIIIRGTTLSFGAMGSFGTTNPYQFYNTTTFPTIHRGDTVSITLNVFAVNDMEPAYFAIWIDYNHNNTFESTELVMQNANTTMALLPTWGAPVSPISKTITIPATATAGTTRVRLMRGSTPAFSGTYSSTFTLSPCQATGGFSYGCTYDMNLNIATATGVEQTVTNNVMNVYPNPAGNNVRIDLPSGVEGKLVEIMDVMGKVVSVVSATSQNNTVNTNALQPGLYTLKVTTTDGSTFLSKFTKQ